MKELKFEPEVEIIVFPRQDIVTASIGASDDGWNEPNDGGEGPVEEWNPGYGGGGGGGIGGDESNDM